VGRYNDGVVLEALAARLQDLHVGGDEVGCGELSQERGDDAPLALIDGALAPGDLYDLSHVSTSRIARSSSASACSRKAIARSAFPVS